SNDNIVRDNGSNVIPMFEPVLVIYRLDANAEAYSIFEYAPNSNHRMHNQKNLTYDGTPATTASNTLTLFATPNHTYRTDGGLMELCLMTRPITDAEIEDVIRYVRHVYPAS